MSSTYAGNPAVFPTSITLPSDGDGPGINAVTVNVAFEGLADRTAHLKGNLSLRSVTFLSDTPAWVVPANVSVLIFEMCGAGGGGGGGRNAAGTDVHTSGGGGGGGAVLLTGTIAVTPGETLAIDIGAAASAVAAQTPGVDGADTTITRVTGSVLLATAKGAAGGRAGVAAGIGGDSYVFSGGGGPVAGVVWSDHSVWHSDGGTGSGWYTGAGVQAGPANFLEGGPQTGGRGASRQTSAKPGRPSPQGFVGGNAGFGGSDSGSYRAGGGGGGGGAGPFGSGGAGGDGTDANNAGASSTGGGGTAGAARGSGGGGGGSQGGASAPAGAGGGGGSGQSGFCRLTYVSST